MDKNKPNQYIKGLTEFYKLKFKVTPDVLIPRSETELLVDEVLKFLRVHPDQTLTALDIGTGSGCIAISIAKNYSNCKIIATDISTEALKIAQQNAKFHQVEDQITFLQSDLLAAFPNRCSDATRHPEPISESKLNDDLIDIIVTNLPYIPDYRIPYLDPSVKDFEPHIALNGGTDGFEIYRTLFQQMIEKNLIPKLFIGEIDYTHGEIAQAEASKLFPKATIKIDLDLAHRQRILIITQD